MVIWGSGQTFSPSLLVLHSDAVVRDESIEFGCRDGKRKEYAFPEGAPKGLEAKAVYKGGVQYKLCVSG